MKTLTNWNIIIVDIRNCSNVRCDKITTVNHTRYNMLLYIYQECFKKINSGGANRVFQK